MLTYVTYVNLLLTKFSEGSAIMLVIPYLSSHELLLDQSSWDTELYIVPSSQNYR